MMHWFGDLNGERTRCQGDDGHVPTPVGERCPFCNHEIIDGDYGEVLNATEISGPRRREITVYVHAGCLP